MNSCRKYEKNIVELSNDIFVFQNLVGKLFEKEKELSSLKLELSRLEKQILHNIQQKASAPGQNLLQQGANGGLRTPSVITKETVW